MPASQRRPGIVGLHSPWRHVPYTPNGPRSSVRWLSESPTVHSTSQPTKVGNGLTELGLLFKVLLVREVSLEAVSCGPICYCQLHSHNSGSGTTQVTAPDPTIPHSTVRVTTGANTKSPNDLILINDTKMDHLEGVPVCWTQPPSVGPRLGSSSTFEIKLCLG